MDENCNDSSESVLKEKEAIESLEKLIEAVENGDLWGFSDRQAEAMVRVAKVLIAAVDRKTTVWETLAQSGSLAKLKNVMEKLIEHITESNTEPNHEPSISEKEALEISIRKCDK